MLPSCRHNSDREAGLSLLEILVGVSIVAILAFAVTLTIGPGRGALYVEADRLATELNHAAAEAIATGQPVGITLMRGGRGYGFVRYLDGRWWPLDGRGGLGTHVLEETIRVEADDVGPRRDDGGAVTGPVPVAWFDPAGLTDPFRLRLTGQAARIELSWQADGRILRSGEGG